MQVYDKTVTDKQGNIKPGANVAVYVYPASGATLADIFSADDEDAEKLNPFQADANGKVVFYAADGDYELIVTDALNDDIIGRNRFQLLDKDNILRKDQNLNDVPDKAQALLNLGVVELANVDAENLPDGVGLFQEREEGLLRFKSLVPGPSGNVQLTDQGDTIIVEVPDPPGGETGAFDIPFTGHVPAGSFRSQNPRGVFAQYSAAEDISHVTILTPWPVDGTELKAAIDIDLKGRTAIAVAPADAQLIYLRGTLHIDREANAFIDGTPHFVGDLASGTKIMVGSIGGFLAAEITFRSDVSAREVTCVASGTVYSEDNDTAAIVISANGGALTGPTAVFGASGLIAQAVTGASSSSLVMENRGPFLNMSGIATRGAGFATNTVLFTLPVILRPRTDRQKNISGIAGASLSFGTFVITAADGKCTFFVTTTAPGQLYFNTLPPIDLRGF